MFPSKDQDLVARGIRSPAKPCELLLLLISATLFFFLAGEFAFVSFRAFQGGSRLERLVPFLGTTVSISSGDARFHGVKEE